MKKVLIIEDNIHAQDHYERQLAGQFILIQVVSADQARKEFATHSDIDAIVVDYGLWGMETGTVLAHEFRKSFTGPMLAASGSNETDDELMFAGCDHRCGKVGVVPTLRKLFPSN